jgi:hypothetical protein
LSVYDNGINEKRDVGHLTLTKTMIKKSYEKENSGRRPG